jgi:hypothetical protein
MNSGQDADPDLPDAEDPDHDPQVDHDPDMDADPEVDRDVDTESLQRARDAIDEGREAAREALKDEADLTSGTPEEPPGAEEETGAG